jgi:phosphate:Na+ symporter
MRNFLVLADSVSKPIYIDILLLLGGLGALLIGMRLMQESTEKLATTGLKKLFRKTANSKLAGVGIGTLATMIMQSSGATTVMVVGFVNAGIMSLAQAVGYIMGANIGTTITAQIVALGGLSSDVFPLAEIFIGLTIVGVMMTMFLKKKNPKVGEVGNLIAGLGLLFLGLNVMTANMTGMFNANQAIKDFLVNTTNPFVLLLVGIVFTVIAQSSSAVTSIVLALAMAGAVIGGSGNGVLYVILGSNIGSCSTALLSAIGSTTNGKRTAIIHLLFNVFGSLLFFIVLLFWRQAFEMTFQRMFPDSPATQIAMFHTFFNLICTIIFLPFTKMFVFLSEKIIPNKKKNPEQDLLDSRFLLTPELALTQAIRYYHIMAKKALDDLNLAVSDFVAKDNKHQQQVDDLEMDVLHMSKELNDFIVQILAQGVSTESSYRISKMQLDIADIVRLTEVADNITGYTNHEIQEELTFSDIVYDQIKVMMKYIQIQFNQAKEIVDNPSMDLLQKTRETENSIDDQRTIMVNGHMRRLSLGECKPQNSNIFINFVGNLERCGDHLNFIAERSCQKLLREAKSEENKEVLHP